MSDINQPNITSTHFARDEQVIKASNFSPSAENEQVVQRKHRPLRFVIFVLLLVALTVLWYIFTAKSVVIKTSPLGGKVELTTGLHFNWQEHLLMQSGDYQVSITKDGYYPLLQTFSVSDKQNQQITFELVPLPGNLSLKVAANTGVTATIDGQTVVVKSNIISDIPAGKHELTLYAENYFPYKVDIDIKGKRQTQNLVVELVPAWAEVMFNSEPIGVQIFKEDEVLGITPFRGQLLEGVHQLNFVKQGYQSTVREIEVLAGQPQTLKSVKLFKLMGRLAISTSPVGVNVSYGDKFLGTTPLEIEVTANKQQDLLLFKEGYQTQSSSLLVPSGQVLNKKYNLLESIGEISFVVSPSDALLYIDGRLMGRAQQTLSLPIKRQSIRIEKEGYVSYQGSILPSDTVEQRLPVVLKTIEQARWENLKPIITTTAGNKLKLFKPDDVFEMGASRREQGRRANEVKRKVRISKAFYLGFTEVSNKEFRQFQRGHSSGHVKGNSLNGTNQPAVKLSWQQAALFCNWLSEKEKLTKVYVVEDGNVSNFDPTANGYRLPTETEWVWAARFQNGEMLKYPWGPNLPPKAGSGNFADISGAPILGKIIPTYNDRYIATAPVASFSSNEKGLFDLSGNVAEWLHDYYQIQTGLSLKINQDSMGPKSGDYHVIRGASWAHGSRTELRLSFRDYGNEKRNDVGFRIARNAQ